MAGEIPSPLNPRMVQPQNEGRPEPLQPVSQRFNILFPKQLPEKLSDYAKEIFKHAEVAKSNSFMNSTVFHIKGREGEADKDCSLNTSSLCKRIGVSRFEIFLCKCLSPIFGSVDDLIKNKALENLKRDVLTVSGQGYNDADMVEILSNLPPELNNFDFAQKILESFPNRSINLLDLLQHAKIQKIAIKDTILEKMGKISSNDNNFIQEAADRLENFCKEGRDKDLNKAVDFLYLLPESEGFGKILANRLTNDADRQVIADVIVQRISTEGPKPNVVAKEFLIQLSRREGSATPEGVAPLFGGELPENVITPDQVGANPNDISPEGRR